MKSPNDEFAGAGPVLEGSDPSIFLPLERLQWMRKKASARRMRAQLASRAREFTVRGPRNEVTFRYGVDFGDGNGRLCWTPTGITKLINVGLWRREFNDRGDLKSKPMSVEAVMEMQRSPSS